MPSSFLANSSCLELCTGMGAVQDPQAGWGSLSLSVLAVLRSNRIPLNWLWLP